MAISLQSTAIIVLFDYYWSFTVPNLYDKYTHKEYYYGFRHALEVLQPMLHQ